jgi:DNA-binding NarL/FixJ family response regulator
MQRWTNVSGDETIRVMIVGSDRLARKSLEQALSAIDGLQVVGLTGWEEDLGTAIDAFQPDVLVAEIDWDATTSSQTQDVLSELDIPTLLLSDPNLDLRGLGDGWLSHGSSPAQISAAIQALAHDLMVFDKPLFEALDTPRLDQTEKLVDPLTPRELEVLQLMAEGLTNRGIAFQLGISEYTVKFHVNAILIKLDAQSRTEASVKAARLGLILL